MERETSTFTLPKSGDVVIAHTYITGGEDVALMRYYLKSASEFDQEQLKEKGQKAVIFEETQKLAFKFIVVSINGKKDGQKIEEGRRFSIVDYINNLRKIDYQFLVKKINDISRGDDLDGEKKSV